MLLELFACKILLTTAHGSSALVGVSRFGVFAATESALEYGEADAMPRRRAETSDKSMILTTMYQAKRKISAPSAYRDEIVESDRMGESSLCIFVAKNKAI